MFAGADGGRGHEQNGTGAAGRSWIESGDAINEGMAHYDKGHWDVAKKHFQEAVQADQQSAEAHYDLALALDKAGDHKGAIEHSKRRRIGKDDPQIQNSGILQAHLKAKH